MRRLFHAALLASFATGVSNADALVWPDVPERVERGLSSPDPARRRDAARDLANLGSSRGAPLVLTALGDADVEVRLAAAQSAIRLRVAGATDAVVAWLGEREPRLRISACELARALPSPRAVQPLARALGDADPLVRSACADALGASGSPEAVAPLSGKLDDATPNVRAQVARALARLGDTRAVVPLVGKVQDSVPEVRQAVVRALGDLGDPRATQALLLALRDSAPEVKIEALSALGRLRADEAAPAIAPLALERSAGVRQAALVALGRIGTPSAVHALIKALGTQEDAGANVERTPVRDALVTAGATAVTELTALLERPASPDVLASAAWVLGELRAKTSAPAIVTALRKGTLPPSAALRALAGAGTPEQIPVVLEYVADPSPAIRAEALLAATALLDPSRPDGRAVEPLAATLKHPRTSPRERATIAMLLGRTGAPRAITELIGLVNAKDESLRLAAIDALGALGHAEPAPKSAAMASLQDSADDALVPLLTDEDPAVRLRAAVALGSSGGPKAKQALLGKLQGGEELDRFALWSALGGILERHPDEASTRRAFAELAFAAGPERDAIISAAGRARIPAVVDELATIAKRADVDDRRAAATALAAHAGSPRALTIARALTADPDAGVRAEATFALGSLGDESIVPHLVQLTRQGDVNIATSAAGSLARIAQRQGAGQTGSKAKPASGPRELAEAACSMVAGGRPTVRANALAALAAMKRRCGDGRLERKLLIEDASDLVRAGAARALVATPKGEDRAALDRCSSSDRSADVARLCRPLAVSATTNAASRTHAVTVFVVGEGAANEARPRTPFLLEYEGGVLRAGTADRRGATFDPSAPAGELLLRRPPSR